ncbi:A24 family peptidase [Orrella sp. JC864]|uniref:prepilin peptidase n=1 Tax=Orrella sp. JC864 TaxID=3120298 RepID=UPI0012BD22EC
MTALQGLGQPGSLAAAALAVLAGLLAGGWLTKLAYRIPLLMERAWAEQCREWLGQSAGQPLALPNAALSDAQIRLRDPSACPDCQVRLPLRQQAPVLGWLMLGRRCAYCRAAISWRYPLTETACGVLFGLCAYVFGAGWLGWILMAFLAVLLLLAAIDLHTGLLPDCLTLPLLWAGLLLNASGHGLTGLHDAVLGAAGGYLFLWLVFHGFRLATGREGMGHGDFKLLAALGAWLGAAALPWLLLGASLAGIVVGVALVATGRASRGQALPFGPYLAAGGMLMLFLGGHAPALHG